MPSVAPRSAAVVALIAPILAARRPAPGRNARLVGEWASPEFEVRAAGDLPVGLDSEPLLMTAPLRFTSLPGALRVRLPRTTAPPRRGAALTRHDLTELAHVASGEVVSRMA